MNFLEFAEKAILYDKRNLFSKYEGKLDCIPDEMKNFYKESNPVDVEINSVRFIQANELYAIQSEYSYLNAQFVFATCNGDPIFLHDGCVYTAPHGVKTPIWELLSKNIETYLFSLLI